MQQSSKARNPKFEIRNKIRNSKRKEKFQTNSRSLFPAFLHFCHWNLFRISCFEFRVFTDFPRPTAWEFLFSGQEWLRGLILCRVARAAAPCTSRASPCTLSATPVPSARRARRLHVGLDLLEGRRTPPGITVSTNTRCQPKPDSMGPCQEPGASLATACANCGPNSLPR